MILTTKYLHLLGLVAFLHRNSSAAPDIVNHTCGLVDLLPNAVGDPYYLPPISEKLQSGGHAWEHTIFGLIRSAGYINNSPHAPYLQGSYNTGTKLYWLSANAKTQDFVNEQQTRELYRRIQITCADNSTLRYSFIIPVQDMTPPEFEKSMYTFNITQDWSLENPITNTIPIPIIVYKTASPINKENENITISYMSSPDVLQVHVNSLWILADQTSYFFRLDIRLKSVLPLGHTRVVLSAIHGFSSSATEIVVNVA